MAIALALVQQKVNEEARACVERKKKAAFLGGFFSPRKKFEPGCQVEARAKFANELAAAEAEAVTEEDWGDDAYRNAVSGEIDKKTLLLVGGTFLFMLIMVLLID